MASLKSGTTIGTYTAIHTNNIGSYALTSVPSNVITTSGGQTIAGITYFSNGESLQVYGIRGRFTNEYIHLYHKVGIGHPNGWGQGEGNTPGYGLSTYGGINIAYGSDNGATINTYTRINKNWGGGDYSAEQLTIRGTYPSIALRSTNSNSKWLIHNADRLQFYYGGTVDDNNWANKFEIATNGNIWMEWGGWLSDLLNAKQNASTAITTSNIGSQSVSYATSAGNSSTTSQIVFNDLKTNFPSGAGGGHSFASNHYSMGLDSGNGGWDSPHYRDLIIGYHTGVRIGAHYSGIRFYDNSPTTDANNDGNGDGGEKLLMTIGGYVGTANHTDVVVNNNLFANVSMRAPIFYDSNDTTYYGDFASTSYLRHLSVGDVNASNDGSWNARLNLTGSSHARLDVKSNSDGIITTMYSHAGQGVGRVGTMSNHPLAFMVNGNVAGYAYANYLQGVDSVRAPIFYDSNDTGYYLDPNGTSNLLQLNTSTRARWGMPRWWNDRSSFTADENYWTGTNGWGTGQGTWANAWKGGFSGWDIWGTGTDHPQGSGYIHAQGIVSGQHYASSDGGSGYGWMMVGAGDATANRYWLRGKWGGSTSDWVEMITTGNIGSQSVSNASTLDGYGRGNTTNKIAYWDSTRNLYVNNPESYSGEVRLGAAWNRGGVYASGNLSLSTSSSQIDFVFSDATKAIIASDGNIYMSWAGSWLSTLLDAKQNASTAITTSNIGSQSVSYASSAGSVAWNNVTSKPSLDYQQEYTFTAPASTDGSGYSWVRVSMGGFNAGGDFVRFSIARAIYWNGSSPYGGPSMDVVAYSREWHGGQEGAVITYGEHGSVPGSGWVTNAGPRDLAGGGYWFYMRIWGGVDYAMRVYRGSGPIGTSWESTSDPGNVFALRVGVNNIGSTHTGFNTTGPIYGSTLYNGTNAVIHAGNIASQSVSYADESGYSASSGSVEWTSVQNKPATFPPSSHTHDDRYLVKGGSWYGSGLPGSRWGGFSVSGGEIVFGDGLPNAGQMGILIDGAYVAGENNGFWSLASDNSWGSRRGMYWDGTYLNFTTNAPPALFSRDLYVDGNRSGNFGNRLIIGATSTPYTLQDGNLRPTAYLRGAYPVLTLDHTETGNTSHGPTIQFVHNGSATNNRQWVIGTNGSGTRLDFGYSDSSNYGNSSFNPHNGIDDYLGVTWMRLDSGGALSKLGSVALRNGFTISQGGSNYGVFNSWVRLDNHYGFYAPNHNGAHFYPNDQTYGAWRITGTRNGWNGINFDAGNGYVTLMVNPSSNTIGFHNQSYGWQFYWEAGVLYCNKNNYGGGTTATVLDSSNYNSYAPTLTGGNASGTWGINVTGSAGSVAWSNVSSKPATWLNEPNLIQGSEPDTIRTSGFFESYLGSGNPTGTWMNYINVRHSNTGNGHGFQIGMSYYDNNLWFRSYSGNIPPSFQSWSRALGTNTDPYPSNMNQYVRTTDDVTFRKVYVSSDAGDNTGGYRLKNTSGTETLAMWVQSGNALVVGNSGFARVSSPIAVRINASFAVNVAESGVAGRIDASNDIVAYSTSDERFKENITPIPNALDKVKTLTGVEFDWRKETKDYHGYVGHDVGVIAQQVKAVLPEAVRTNANGYLAVRYEKLIGLLIEANKELAARVEELEKKLG